MNINELKTKPIWQMTGEEFLCLHQNGEQNVTVNQPTPRKSMCTVFSVSHNFSGVVCPPLIELRKAEKSVKSFSILKKQNTQLYICGCKIGCDACNSLIFRIDCTRSGT